jgi:hypothetical protein
MQMTSMTVFHESFMGMGFILPLIPGAGGADPKGYLHNHPTSSIAYAVNFGMRIVGHKKVPVAYQEVLGNTRLGHYHNNSRESVIKAYTDALAAHADYCARAKVLKDGPSPPTTHQLVNLWVHGKLDAPAAGDTIPGVAWEGPHSIFSGTDRRRKHAQRRLNGRGLEYV